MYGIVEGYVLHGGALFALNLKNVTLHSAFRNAASSTAAFWQGAPAMWCACTWAAGHVGAK